MKTLAAIACGAILLGVAAQYGCSEPSPPPAREAQLPITIPDYIWVSPDTLAKLPMSGSAWEALYRDANKPISLPNLSNQDDAVNVCILAKALVYVRTGKEQYRKDVITACMAAMGSEQGGRTLALGRELIAYVIAANLVTLPQQEDARFRKWLRRCLSTVLQRRTLISTHEDRPNNWGTHAGASRAAVATYLQDEAELRRCARILRGYLGDRRAYAGFKYRELSWQFNEKQPVGINPKGATRGDLSIDGVLPDDQRRGGYFTWPPPKENYVYEALQGVLAQAIILTRAGYNVWEWEDQAILRAFQWLHTEANFPAEGDDTWQPHIINHYYGSNFPAPIPSRPGKGVGYTDWTHGSPPHQ